MNLNKFSISFFYTLDIESNKSARNNMPVKQAAIRINPLDQKRTTHFKPLQDSVRVYKEMFRFSLSSLFCAVIDVGLFSLILNMLSANAISWSLFGATSIARLISAVANFLINKKIVFESRASASAQAKKYFMLCAIQMLFSWLILQGITSLINEHVVLLKIMTDIFLFLTNFLVQRIFIFRRQSNHEKPA